MQFDNWTLQEKLSWIYQAKLLHCKGWFSEKFFIKMAAGKVVILKINWAASGLFEMTALETKPSATEILPEVLQLPSFSASYWKIVLHAAALPQGGQMGDTAGLRPARASWELQEGRKRA